MNPFLSKKTLLAASLMASAVFSTATMAAEGLGTASATVQTPISVSETTPMTFGEIAKTEGAVCTIAPGANSATGPGCVGGTVASGAFSITADAGSLDVSISVTNPTVDGITFAPVWNDGSSDINAGSSSTITATTDPYTLNVGGSLTVGAGATSGAKTWNYTVAVTYP